MGRGLGFTLRSPPPPHRTITDRCRRLRQVFEARGHDVGPTLRPGLTGQSYAESLGLPIERIPPALLELYRWRNGCDEARGTGLLFRDNVFISAERARDEMAQIRARFDLGAEERFDLRAVLPVASYQGSVFAVVPGVHALSPWYEHPVICLFERRVSVVFLSLAAMLDTCIDWVKEPSWNPYDGLDPDLEQRIWQRHNPGLPLLPS